MHYLWFASTNEYANLYIFQYLHYFNIFISQLCTVFWAH